MKAIFPAQQNRSLSGWVRQIARVVERMIHGGLQCYGTLTLAANAGSTVVDDRRATEDSVVILMPKTAHAAEEWAAGSCYFHSATNGSFTLYHANRSYTDMRFDYIILG